MNKKAVVLWDYYQAYHLARLRALHAEAAGRGWNVVGLAAATGGAARDGHSIVTSVTDPAPEYLGEIEDDLNSRRVAERLEARLASLIPDAVLFPGYGFRASRSALAWCRRHRRAAVMMFESQERDFPRRWLREWLKRRLVRRADTAFCGGSSHARYAAKLGMPADRTFTGYSAVDNEFWRTSTLAARAQAPSLHSPYFLSVGRFVAKKNFVGLIGAFARFKQEDRNDWQLVLLGDGPEKNALCAEIDRQRLTASVHLPGYANVATTAAWFAHAGAFVLPSDRAEQWGLVVNEAMAAGVPVIVSRVCGCVEDLVDDGTTGIVFDPAQPETLRQALVTMAANSDLRYRLATAGQQRVDNFSLQRFASQAFAACEKALVVAAARST